MECWWNIFNIYDVSFLMGIAKSDFVYLKKVLGLNQKEFLSRFEERLRELDLNFLARDVEPFLFDSKQQERVTSFRDYWFKR
ncbi:hypothetical protein D1AOALGA4SA_4992 [Olavius algarvensis Delta 1 endosymbiont]|nr:hypothetical protein D1AOALGA4SA_4992 [Olavius algarvensis Delta 1 endosymbiont]